MQFMGQKFDSLELYETQTTYYLVGHFQASSLDKCSVIKV